MKLAAVHEKISAQAEHFVIDTGQHYDPALAGTIYEEFSIPKPYLNLAIGSGSHNQHLARSLQALDEPVAGLEPDWVLVFGDTNTTVAAALAARKLGFRVAHLEAGMRSFDRTMPEEVNRVATDHLSDVCFASTPTGFRNLTSEGLASRSLFIGDVMVDLLHDTLLKLDIPLNREQRTVEKRFIATIHRSENTDRKDRLVDILSSVNRLPLAVTLYAHPRLLSKMAEYRIAPRNFKNIDFLDPVGYHSMVRAVSNSSGVITDSGGLQREAFVMNVPCVTMREATEWQETVASGWNMLAGPDTDAISTFLLDNDAGRADTSAYGDGTASSSLIAHLKNRL